MEHAKKMLLVDPSVLEKINQPNTTDNPLSRLDTEMQNILKSDMEERKKCTLYLQVLQRYLHFAEEGRRPIKLPIVSNIEVSDMDNSGYDTVDNKNNLISVKDSVTVQTSNEGEEQVNITVSNGKPTPYTPKHILSLVPKTYIKKGERLLFLLTSNKNKIHWDVDGTISVDKEKIPGSNIVDLVNDFLRPLKRSAPIGWEKFAKALKDIKIPLIYIGNPQRADYMQQLPITPFKEYTPRKEEEEFSTPVTSKTRQKIDWEKWSPY